MRKKDRIILGSCKRRDCKYFAKNTKTCDYRLITGSGRGNPVCKCTHYEQGDRKPQSPWALPRT